ncbi:hypothetical protein CCYA_CCYA05G1542 [Cyanidiococcus yangmingshanensis]|nr:hypothetical protein CCYA_CCYA05G1542 [Cyanidiococcus yangmingshanensis]
MSSNGSEDERQASAEKLRQRLLEKMQAEREALREQEARWASSHVSVDPRAAHQGSLASSNPFPESLSLKQETRALSGSSPLVAGASPAGTSEAVLGQPESQNFPQAPEPTKGHTERVSETTRPSEDAQEAQNQESFQKDEREDDESQSAHNSSHEPEVASAITTAEGHSESPEPPTEPMEAMETSDKPASSALVSDTVSVRVSSDGSLASCQESPVLRPADWSEHQTTVDWTKDTPEVCILHRVANSVANEPDEEQPDSNETRQRQSRKEHKGTQTEPETDRLVFEWSTRERLQLERAVQTFCAAAVTAHERSLQRIQDAENKS